MKFLQKLFGPPAEMIWLAPASATACPFCGTKIVPGANGLKCTGCDSTPRLRSMSVLLPHALASEHANDTASRPLLAFSSSKSERNLLAPYFANIVSVSLFGGYGHEHTRGVDARDLSRFPDGSFGGHYSCLLFDYFIEHEQAIAEAYRVVAPGGMFLTHILHTRLKNGGTPPKTKSVIRPKPGYYEYIPEDQHMLSVQIGATWFMRALSSAGFRATRFRIGDPAGVVCDWFLGRKVQEITPRHETAFVASGARRTPDR